MALTDVLVLPKSSAFSDPENQNDLIPILYGDLDENSGDQGVTVCPCVDTVSAYKQYAVSSEHIAGGGSGTFFDSTGEIASVSFVVSNTPAYVTFASDPSGTVSYRGYGKPDSSGTLIENPITLLEDLLDYGEAQGLSVPTRHPTSWARAKITAEALGYKAAGAIVAENSLAFWLTSILSNFLGSWKLNSAGELEIWLDTSINNDYHRIAGFLQERKSTISGTRRRTNIVNQVFAQYAISYTQQDRRYKENVLSNYRESDDGTGTKDAASITSYGVKLREMQFDWIRETATMTAIQSRIVEKFKDPLWVLDWKEEDWMNMPVEEGDPVVFSWKELSDAN
ncbi:MAG: hypothetical protein GY807_05745, partial [Gammaproteobacteria bacterium]|nr:hypothetical protein [Gammaproteobacteria bacterium]